MDFEMADSWAVANATKISANDKLQIIPFKQLGKVQDTLELALEYTFCKSGSQGMISSIPVGSKRSFGSGLPFGGVMEDSSAPQAQICKQTLAVTILLKKTANRGITGYAGHSHTS
jgi:hypothetical protein